MPGYFFLFFLHPIPKQHYGNKKGRNKHAQSNAGSNNSSAKPYWLHFLLVAFISLCSYYVLSTDTYNQFNLPGARIGKYKASKYSPGIIKLESQSSLVYVKYVRGFYDTDHNPTICWKGSGYEFQQIQYNNINGFSFLHSTIGKG